MEARPEENPNISQQPELVLVTGGDTTAASPQTDVTSDLPEAKLADRLSQILDGDLPLLVNPRNDTLPSEDGKNALECLQALGTTGLPHERKTYIVGTLRPFIENKVGKKALKNLIGLDSPETREISASGFSVLKTTIAMEATGGMVQTPNQVKKSRRRNYDPTEESLNVLGNPDSKESEKQRAIKKLLRPRMMVTPEEFFGSDETIYETIKCAMEAGEPNIAQAHYDLRAPMMNGYKGHSLESIEKLIKAWESSEEKESEFYENGIITKLQTSFLTQMKLLTIPDHMDAARFAKDEIKEAMLLLHDANSPRMRLDNVRALVDSAAGKALSFSAFPEGLRKDVAGRIEGRLQIVRMPAQIVGKEQNPMSALERVIFLLEEAYGRIEKLES